MLMLHFSIDFQTVWQSVIGFGSIHVFLLLILKTSLSLCVLVFWYLIFWIYFTSKYWCVCTNTQYSEIKLAADAYVTLLYVLVNSMTKCYRIFIHSCIPFTYIGNLFEFMCTCMLVYLILWIYFTSKYWCICRNM